MSTTSTSADSRKETTYSKRSTTREKPQSLPYPYSNSIQHTQPCSELAKLSGDSTWALGCWAVSYGLCGQAVGGSSRLAHFRGGVVVAAREVRVSGVGAFFFFQAEDGIRDYKVTGVQTCALPI